MVCEAGARLGLAVLSSLGKTNFMAVGDAIVVVKIKKVISKKPRSTIGVRSTLVEDFFSLITPFEGDCKREVCISAIFFVFNKTQKPRNYKTKELQIKKPHQ
jgi:hypothetical protein